MARKSRRVTCKDCGSRNEVIDGLCATCEGDHYAYCTVCRRNRYIDCDTPCRHLFWAEWGEWIGPGSIDDPIGEHCKDSFFVVLDKLGVKPAKLLATTIRQKKINVRFYGSLLGYDGLSMHLYNPKGEYQDNFGELFTKDLTRELEREMSNGVNWLAGLYCNKTIKANKITLTWIKEWLLQAQTVKEHAA